MTWWIVNLFPLQAGQPNIWHVQQLNWKLFGQLITHHNRPQVGYKKNGCFSNSASSLIWLKKWPWITHLGSTGGSCSCYKSLSLKAVDDVSILLLFSRTECNAGCHLLCIIRLNSRLFPLPFLQCCACRVHTGYQITHRHSVCKLILYSIHWNVRRLYYTAFSVPQVGLMSSSMSQEEHNTVAWNQRRNTFQ